MYVEYKNVLAATDLKICIIILSYSYFKIIETVVFAVHAELFRTALFWVILDP
jgi:hypothetical protein